MFDVRTIAEKETTMKMRNTLSALALALGTAAAASAAQADVYVYDSAGASPQVIYVAPSQYDTTTTSPRVVQVTPAPAYAPTPVYVYERGRYVWDGRRWVWTGATPPRSDNWVFNAQRYSWVPDDFVNNPNAFLRPGDIS